MSTRSLGVLGGAAIAGVIIAALAVASFAIFRDDPWGERGEKLPANVELDLSEYFEIPAALIRYTQTATIPVELTDVRAVSVGPDDEVYVAGDRVVHIYQTDGRLLRSVEVDGEPTCLAIGDREHVQPGRTYVGLSSRVEIYNADGLMTGVSDDLGDKAVLTSIALGKADVLVADAGNRVVLRLDQNGKVLGRIGDQDSDREMHGFIVPSAYFDLAIGPDELLYVANPGARRIESYTLDGQLQSLWGEASSAISGFFGCCNPVHFTLLPDGRFVTSEKGIPRVKLYNVDGEFECVVAGPKDLAVTNVSVGDPRLSPDECVFDVAADSQGYVLVLDPRSKMVRVFAPNDGESGADL